MKEVRRNNRVFNVVSEGALDIDGDFVVHLVGKGGKGINDIVEENLTKDVLKDVEGCVFIVLKENILAYACNIEKSLIQTYVS